MIRIPDKFIPIPESGCLIWDGSSTKAGYGDFRIRPKHYLVHRAVWENHYGIIPEGMHVLHKCDVKLCARIDHLFLGTNNDNIKDSIAKGRRKGITRHRPSGLKYKRMSLEGIENHRKIKSDKFQEIKDLYESGHYTQHLLAKKYGVSSATINRILKI